MKKLFINIVTVVAALCMSVTAMAATSSVSVKNNIVTSEPVSYTYKAGEEGEVVISIKSLMEKLDGLEKEESVVQTITVSSESADKSPVEFRLRLSIPENDENKDATPSPSDYQALDYYNIIVTDTSGAVLYSYEEAQETEEGATYKDINLATLNTVRDKESKIFNITVSINEELDKSSVAKSAKNLDWNIVSGAPVEPTQSPETPAPTEEVTVTDEPTTAPTASTSLKEDKNGVLTVQAGEYVCGTDFEEGRYTATGSGKVSVYSSSGKLKTAFMLKDANDKTSTGSTEHVVNIEEDEKIVVESETKLTPYIASKATTAPKSTTTPSKSTATTDSSTGTSSKNNPKTGDTVPVVLLASVGVMAMGMIAYIETKKRKKN